MQPINNAVIAAAGLGSRLGLGLPKCMLEIRGKTILSRLVTRLSQHVKHVYIVTGYREDLIIDHCRHHHRDTVIVRNPEFRTTNTAESLAMGARYLKGKTLFLDGDLLFAPNTLEQFIQNAAAVDTQVGITTPETEHTVYATVETSLDSSIQVTGFSRSEHSKYEWANVFVAQPEILSDATGYVYEVLESQLPAPAHYLELSEVDTEADLARTEEFVLRHDI